MCQNFFPFFFQTYNSTKHHLHTALCTYGPKQNLLPSSFIIPFPLAPSPTPLSFWLSPHCCLCLCFICIIFCPESLQHVLWKIEIFIEEDTEQETLYIGPWCLSPFQSRHLGTSHSSPNCHQLSHCISLNLINGLKSVPFQRWF